MRQPRRVAAMSDQYVSVPRELLELAREFLEGKFSWADELLAPLNAPAEDVRAVVDEPLGYAPALIVEEMQRKSKGFMCVFRTPSESADIPVYLRPQRPVVLQERAAMRDAIAQAIGGDAYDCTRVWSAWSVGTMSQDDFVPIIDQEDRLGEIVEACLDAVEELNK